MAHKYKGYEISLLSSKNRSAKPVPTGVQAHPTFNPFHNQFSEDAPCFAYQSLYIPLEETAQASYEKMRRHIDEEHERCLEETGYLHPSADL